MPRMVRIVLMLALLLLAVQPAFGTDGEGPYLEPDIAGCKIAYKEFEGYTPLEDFTYHFQGGVWGGELCLNGFMPKDGEFLGDVTPVVAAYGATEIYQKLDPLVGQSMRPLEDCWPQTIGFHDVNEDDVPDILFQIVCYDGERDMSVFDNMVYISGENGDRVEWRYEPMPKYVAELSDYNEFVTAAETEAPVGGAPPPPPPMSNAVVDAAADWWNKAIFFEGASFIVYDKAADRADPGYPQSLGSWPGVWDDGVDAAVNWGNGKVYLFKGPQYVRYDANKQAVDEGYPQSINERTWPGVWPEGTDAAINWGDGKAYFFRGSEYIRYDIQADRADPGYPQPMTAQTWPGLWTDGVDAAAAWGNGKAYFFHGSEYVRYDVPSGRPDAGYPKAITGSTWPGLAP